MGKIGDFLKELRGKMTLREASERSGLSHSYIRYLEIGKRPGSNTPINPTPETLKQLAKAYDYPYADLLKKAGYIEETNDDTADFADILNDPDFELFYYGAKKLDEEKKKELKSFIDYLNTRDEFKK